MTDQESIDRIVERFRTVQGNRTVEVMSRGTVIVDENVQALAGALRKRNLRVIIPRQGMDDATIKSELLPHRIFITKNAKDFVYEASSYEYGIIALENLSFIDPEPDPTKNKTAQIISKAIIDHGLWSKRHGFILILNENGGHQYHELTS